ncbi:MAG: Hint domain-containing protein [Pseudomonadota bacterium]
MPTLNYFSLDDITVDGGSTSGVRPLNASGNGSKLDNATITLSSNAELQSTEITDNNSTFNDDQDSNQKLANPEDLGFRENADVSVDNEYTLVLQSGNDVFTAYAFAVGNNENVVGLSFVGDVPPLGVPLTVIDTGEPNSPPEYSDLISAICFTPGTMILTPQGERAIETLHAGDPVITRDGGVQTLRWAGSSKYSAADMATLPHLRPVLIRAHAFGPGVPARDMRVSPNHRFMVDGWRAMMLFGQSEVLVRALAMRNDISVMTDFDVKPVEYIHLLFDTHQVITADGTQTESFQPAEAVTDGLSDQVRDELLEIMPHLRTGEMGALGRPARQALSDQDAQVLLFS